MAGDERPPLGVLAQIVTEIRIMGHAGVAAHECERALLLRAATSDPTTLLEEYEAFWSALRSIVMKRVTEKGAQVNLVHQLVLDGKIGVPEAIRRVNLIIEGGDA